MPQPSHQDSQPWVLETEDLWRIYKQGTHQEVVALRGVTLQIPAGRFVALKGRSGSGKTTLLNCVGGLDHPTKGAVKVFGDDIAGMSDRALTEWRRHKVGFVFQSFGLSPTLSAYENVELMLRLAGKGGRERRQRTDECLALVGLSKWAHHRPGELSGGQQQRVAIARALANRPRLILADEPTGELDSSTAREILSLILGIVQQEQVTCLMVTHDPLVSEYAEQILTLKSGQVMAESLEK